MMVIDKLKDRFNSQVSLAPLVILRIVFGLIMCFSALRFLYYGWVESLYIQPNFFFSYWGMTWIKPFNHELMIASYIILAISALGMALGAFFRFSSFLFLILFTYIELIDKTYYLNHYYFVSIFAFLMLISPAHRRFSIDSWRNPSILREKDSNWFRLSFILQLSLVYIFAGLAKVHSEWLLEAMPLKIWLPARIDVPIIGSLLKYESTAYIFSWAGMIYDLCIPFLLINRKTFWLGFSAVIAFHFITWILFPIGVFPWVMIGCSLVFMPSMYAERVLKIVETKATFSIQNHIPNKAWKMIFIAFFLVQIIVPLRYLTFNNEILWFEEGFRFSWRVMLVEKNGSIQYNVVDKSTGVHGIEDPSSQLSAFQQKQMSMQPDMILQYAHFIAEKYKKQGIDIAVYADSFISFNGRSAVRYINPEIDLASINQHEPRANWMMPYEY